VHVEFLAKTGETPFTRVAERSFVVGEHHYGQHLQGSVWPMLSRFSCLLPVFEVLDLPKPLLCGRLGPIGTSEIFPRLTHDFISTLHFLDHVGTLPFFLSLKIFLFFPFHIGEFSFCDVCKKREVSRKSILFHTSGPWRDLRRELTVAKSSPDSVDFATI